MNWSVWGRCALAMGLLWALSATTGCGDDDDDDDQAPECARDADCGEGEACEQGECVPADDPLECERDRDCDEGEACEQGECVADDAPECARDADCDDGEVCEEGQCVADALACEEDGDCDDGEVCEGGECVPDDAPECVRDRDCRGGEVCERGECVPDDAPECVRDADCDADEVCERGECVADAPECVRDQDCEVGEVCREGECVEDELPQTDIALAAPELTLEAFTVVVDATSTMVTPGQPVTLSARPLHGAPEGALSLAWSFEGAPQVEAEAADAPEQTLRFGAAGRFLVRLTATDEGARQFSTGALVIVLDPDDPRAVGDVDGDGDVDGQDDALAAGRLAPGATLEPAQFERADVDVDGRVTDRDVDLIRSAVNAGALAPRDLNPVRGSFGRRVNLIHPALLDPAVVARLIFDGAPAQVPVRGLPGYATFIVPVELQTAGLVSLSLEIDGQLADQFDFEILAAPTPSPDPGAKVLDALNRLNTVVAALPDLTDEYLLALEANRDERAALIGALQFASNSLALQRDAFADAFAMMEDDGRATFEQIALSNGLDDVLAELEEVQDQLRVFALADSSFFVSPENSQRLLDIVCTLKQVVDISDQVANINSIASDVIGFLDFFPVNRLPGVGGVISFLSNVSKIIEIVTDAIAAVGRFVPDFGDMEVSAEPAVVSLGQSSQVTATIQLRLLENLCDQLGGDLVADIITQLQASLTRAIVSNVPFLGAIFGREGAVREEAGFVGGLIIDAIDFLADAVLDAIGVEDVLNSLLGKLCEFIGGADPVLTLEPDVRFSCGGAGDTFTCVEACLGGVTATATDDICGEEEEGEAPITCICESDCDEVGVRTCDGDRVIECQEIAPDCLQLREVEVCVDPESCVDGVCVAEGCNPTSCPDGCCDAQDNCVGFDAQSEFSCGRGGDRCLVCSGDDPVCEAGVCQEGGGGQCGCGTPGVSFEIVEGCSPDTFPDAQECSGFHSVFCFNDNADPNDPLCQFTPESDEAFEESLFDDGTTFSAFECTIQIACP